MYETEANSIVELSSQISPDAVAAFGDLREKLVSRTVLPWSEHCTECVWPTCYSTCELYIPRQDGRCRRFVQGMVRIDCPAAVNGYLLKIRFKRWGKLWTPGSIRLRSMQEAQALEKRDYRIGKILQNRVLPDAISRAAAQKRYSFKKRAVSHKRMETALPSAFVFECHNPGSSAVQLSLTMRSDTGNRHIPFQKLINIAPGFQRISIPITEISAVLDLQAPFSIDLIPNSDLEETTLYFGLMEFVKEVPVASDKAKKIKCIVWDLDNTMWDGILVEDGANKLRIKPDIASIIRVLDARGILHSIASKNNHDDAIQVLKSFGLEEYFLYPQISWQPKSEGLKAIAQQLNIGIDTLLFVDDSRFELEQVKAACPEVRVLDAAQYRSLLEMHECQAPVTAESRERRKLYQVESHRQDIAASFGDDYMAFLRNCEIKLSIRSLTTENLERVHELTQRTNQMNFSGNRYDREVLKNVISSPHSHTYVLSCEDRFGSYGVIGFSIVDVREPRMIDLMFSCRIQSKRVEHAFLAYILRKYLAECDKDFHVSYRKTPRNAPSGRVFEDLGLQEVAVNDGVTDLVFRKGQAVLDDELIQIVVHQDELSVA